MSGALTAYPNAGVSPRIWGRTGTPPTTWEVRGPDANGDLSNVRITWLIQVLKMNLGEDPIYNNWGIDAQQALVTQVLPDFYVNVVQQQFAQYFASLQITKQQPTALNPNPVYNIAAITFAGAVINVPVAV